LVAATFVAGGLETEERQGSNESRRWRRNGKKGENRKRINSETLFKNRSSLGFTYLVRIHSYSVSPTA
jgi:hypothetical protein